MLVFRVVGFVSLPRVRAHTRTYARVRRGDSGFLVVLNMTYPCWRFSGIQPIAALVDSCLPGIYTINRVDPVRLACIGHETYVQLLHLKQGLRHPQPVMRFCTPDHRFMWKSSTLSITNRT